MDFNKGEYSSLSSVKIRNPSFISQPQFTFCGGIDIKTLDFAHNFVANTLDSQQIAS